MMKYRRLGNAGLKVSVISLGAWTTYGDSVQDKRLIAVIKGMMGDVVARSA